MRLSRIGVRIFAAGIGVASCGAAFSQTFASKPVRMMVGQTAGGSTDIAARQVASELDKVLGQPVVVENRPGADNTIAARAVMRAEPDGYTILFVAPNAMHPVLVKENPVDATKELAWIGASISSPLYYFVRSDLPITTVKDLVAHARANPGKLNFGAAATVSVAMMNLFESTLGFNTTKIPYKGAGPVLTAMLAGEADISNGLLSTYLPAVQSGKVKPLFSSRRSATIPGLPTSDEVGFGIFDIASTFSLFAPLGTPAGVIRTLTAANATAVKSPRLVAELRKQDAVPMGTTPEEALREFEKEIRFWTLATAAKP